MFVAKPLTATGHGTAWCGHVLPLVLIAILLGSGGAGGQATAQPGFFDDLTVDDEARWERSDGWSNGDWMGCSWARDQIAFEGGRMTLVLDDTPGADRPLSCAEYRTREHFHYGRYEVSMQAARGEGVVSAFLPLYRPGVRRSVARDHHRGARP